MKRKAECSLAREDKLSPTKKNKSAPVKKKEKERDSQIKSRFRQGLFDSSNLNSYTQQYGTSSPYKHCVIDSLVHDQLLRNVRSEIKDSVSFTTKETDIYKIHQSGDLANLDGLDNSALEKLPSLLALRDALYSPEFREYVAHITGSGPLSGRKTDMAINVYTPGCYLLCHDDVIGSRKVSYILYLTDPDIPWKPEWGGALRLFPVSEMPGEDGQVAKVPSPDVSKIIPPAWNQLSFFAVQPGESFHDVEEVYHAANKEQLVQGGGRVRMAISGWFHIPQPGEDGFVEGAEERAAKYSSLMQLQGNPDQYDEPQLAKLASSAETEAKNGELQPEDVELGDNERDFEYLLQYMSPTYLTPDTMKQARKWFDQNSSITLPSLLNKKFGQRLKQYIEKQENTSLPEDSVKIEKTGWKVARPPHKHRYIYMQPSEAREKNQDGDSDKAQESPLRELIDEFLPSPQFRRWLQMATCSQIESHDLLARRFRRGKDYTLATGYTGQARLEINLGLTPTGGWGDVDEDGMLVEQDTTTASTSTNGTTEREAHTRVSSEKSALGGKDKAKKQVSKSKPELVSPGSSEAETELQEDDESGEDNGGDEDKENRAPSKKPATQPEQDDPDVGGQEIYMAAEDEDDAADAAVYKAGRVGAEDENILFFQAASWNKLTIALRDSGALRFVKYVSRRAPGDRWDVSGLYGITDLEEDAEEDTEDEQDDEGSDGVEEDEDEEDGADKEDEDENEEGDDNEI